MEQGLLCLEGLAALTAAAGGTARAVRLLAVAAESRRSLGVTAKEFVTDLPERVLGAARCELGEKAGARLLEEGRAISFEDAVDLALAPLD